MAAQMLTQSRKADFDFRDQFGQVVVASQGPSLSHSA